MRTVVFLLSLLAFFACEKKNQSSETPKTHRLVLTEKELRFITDSTTPNFSAFCQYIPETENTVIYNFQRGEFVFFDIKSGVIIKKAKLNTDLHGKFFGGIFHGDSLTIVSYKGELCLFDSELNLLNKTRFADDFCNNIRASARTPIIKADGKTFIAGMCYGNQNFAPVLYKKDSDSKFEPVEILSNNFKKQFWGGTELENVYWTFNDKQGKIYLSYPPDNYVYWFSVHNPLEKGSILMKSDKTDTIISVIKDMDMFNSMSESEILRVYFSTDSYSNIIYDTYRNVFYRITTFALKEDYDPKSNERVNKKMSVSTFNSEGMKIGEDYFDGDWNCASFFLTRDGLYFYNTKKSQQNEEIMFFDLFELKPFEK